MTTNHTTRLTALFPSTSAEAVHSALASIVAPVGERHFSTAPNRQIGGTGYVFISTVTLPEVAEAWRQVAGEHPVDLSPTLSPYAPSAYEPMPATGDPVIAGDIYEHGGYLWMARQGHLRTEHEPGEVLALFVRYRHPEQGLDWIPAETVEAGTLREYGGQMYRAIQGHTTQTTWEPPAVPALWALVEVPSEQEEGDAVQQWEPGISVTAGEEYEYQGTTYRVIQSHTTLTGWEPPAVPALWEAV